jgi:uncharacterized protein YeaO (DUF488 family)
MLAKYVGDLTLPFYYVDGPPAMVSAMRQTLDEARVDYDNVRTEEFSGYSEAGQGWDMNIKIKRVYEQPDKEDGRRILVDRIWPRGISKDKGRLSDWRRGYRAEQRAEKVVRPRAASLGRVQRALPRRTGGGGQDGRLARHRTEAREENVTLLYGANDTQHNNARALEDFVGEV